MSGRPAKARNEVLGQAIRSIKARSRGMSFFQLTRLVYRIQAHGSGEHGRIPEVRDAIDFTSQVSMAFPTSDVTQLDWEPPPPRLRRTDPDALPHVEASTLGLAGHLGPLPDTYTALITSHPRGKDSPLRAFLDVFNHRLLSLFYEAWELGHPWLVKERGLTDPLTRRLFALAGLDSPAARESLPQGGQVLVQHAASLIRRPVSAETVKAVLTSYLGSTPFGIRDFVGSWMRVDEDSMSRVGRAYQTTLGGSCVVGRRYFDVQGRVAVRLGPLTWEQYLEHLPGGSRAVDIERLVKLMAGSHLAVATEILVDREHIPGARLGRRTDGSGRLSRSAFLGSPVGSGRVVVRVTAGDGRRVEDEADSTRPPL